MEKKKINKSTEKQFNFRSFGVGIGIKTEKVAYLKEILRYLKRIFPDGFEQIDEREVEYFFVIESRKPRGYTLYRNGEKLLESVSKDTFFEMTESQIRLCIAEFAVGKVFLHAGVVGWKGKAIIMPAMSFSGKTTLVAELIKRGALYYSDEYAVLDDDGKVHPFPKWLSMRGIIDAHRQVDRPVESFGGSIGTKGIPVGMVLIAKYKKEKRMPKSWQPKHLSLGQGIMEILPHTLPIRNNPKFVLEVLNKLASRAIIVKTERGEAEIFADTLLAYFERLTD